MQDMNVFNLTMFFNFKKQERRLANHWHHDPQHYGIQHNDTKHNVTQLNDIQRSHNQHNYKKIKQS
jgi:hypothetical protein